MQMNEFPEGMFEYLLGNCSFCTLPKAPYRSGILKRNSPSGQDSKHRTGKDRDRVTETCCRHYASVFLLSAIFYILHFSFLFHQKKK